jgi:hypothetical protein
VARMRVEKEKVVSASFIAWCFSVLTILDYMSKRGFKYSDITATRKSRTAMRGSVNSSQKQATSTHYFSK